MLKAVATEISATGVKERSFVHFGARPLAIQNTAVGQSVTFEHYDPSGASYRATDLSGSPFDAAEMDPFGADAGTFRPITVPPRESIGEIQPYYGVPDLNSATQGCVLDRVPISCEVLNNLQEAGGVDAQTLMRDENGQWDFNRHTVKSFGLGIFTTKLNKLDEFGHFRDRNEDGRPDPELVMLQTNNDVTIAISEAAKLAAQAACKKFIDDLGLKGAMKINKGKPLTAEELIWVQSDLTATALMNKVTAAQVVLDVNKVGPLDAAATANATSQTITYYKGFFFDMHTNSLVTSSTPAKEWVATSTKTRAQSVIHEGLHLLNPQFSDQFLGEIISGKTAPGKSADEDKKWGSGIIKEAVKKNCK